MEPTEILEGLNPEQRAVVEHHEGALRVGAVAGAGKTNALVKRIAYLIAAHDVEPETILAVTFSTRAAKEMNVRLRGLGVDIRRCRIGTWHSLAWQIVREESEERWEVDSKNQYRTILKEVCGYKGMKWDRADITVLTQFVTRCKARAAAPQSEEARAIAGEMRESNPKNAIPALLIEAYGRAELECRDRGLITFDDMLVDAARFLEDETIRARWSSKWNYVLQDECQDENFAQQLIAEALARRHGNYMVVGDPAQAIYGFRGSDPKGLLTFGERWGATEIHMHRNYRSGPAILEAANAVLAAMPIETRLDMELTAERDDAPGEVRGSMYVDSEEESQAIAQEVLQNLSDGARWKDHAILYRTNAQSRTIEEAFLAERIPYVVVGGTSFYRRKEVRCLLGYLRVATARGDYDDVKRTLNAPFRFLGRKYLDRVKDAYDCGPVESGWMDAVRDAAETSGVWAKQRAAAHSYAALVDGLQAAIRKAVEVDDADPDAVMLRDDAKPAVLLREVLAETEYVKWLRRDEGAESAENDRVTNVRELIRAAEKFPTVAELLDYVDDQIRRSERAARENDGEDQVLLMTIHKSKGLEWPRVFLTGAIDGVLPHGKAEDPNEERRLFYVALTRARDAFRVTCPETATFKGRVGDCLPSRYCEEAGIDMGPKGVGVAEVVDIRSRVRSNPDVVATEARHAAWARRRWGRSADAFGRPNAGVRRLGHGWRSSFGRTWGFDSPRDDGGGVPREGNVSMRSGGLASAEALHELRRGEVDFDVFVAAHMDGVLGRVRYFLRRWPLQDLHDEQDLVQEALLALWRAVDSWVPVYVAKRKEEQTATFCGVRFVLTPITKYVDYQVGRALEKRLRKASGWPSKDRPRPARRVVVEDVYALLGSVPAAQGRRVEAEEAALGLDDALEREVALAVVRGSSLDEAAASIYGDASRRLQLQLDSREHAARFVGSIARRAVRTLAG
jgi:DNA helicase-2/ATP-dependent DNA helicase PcrA